MHRLSIRFSDKLRKALSNKQEKGEIEDINFTSTRTFKHEYGNISFGDISKEHSPNNRKDS